MEKERLFKHLERKYSSKREIIPILPLGVSADDIWDEVLQSRKEKGIFLPLTNVNGEPYWYLLTNKMVSASEVIVDELMEHDSSHELHNSTVSTIEEIYFTGFLEGAQISIQDAMDFLQSGNEPESAEELILINNRQASGFAAENMYHAIDENYLHNLAYFLTEGLDNGGGDFRITDTIDIPSMQGEPILLPPANQIPVQVRQFSDFLSDTTTHPLIKSAAAQAWILAVRPFPEGNERLARLLSNVILIRAGYGFFGDISISAMIARTSYDYFRAIANTLRTENGADLTYFIEYYMTALSGSVNELRSRRDQQTNAVLEEERRMAAIPLAQPQQAETTDDAESPPQSSGTQGTHQRHIQLIDQALSTLYEEGHEQFSLAEISDLTGLGRKQVSKLLLPYEAQKRIYAIRKSRAGNLYSFKQSEPPQDDPSDHHTEEDQGDIDSDLRDYLLSALKERVSVGKGVSSDVASALLALVQNGKYRFTTEEIAQSLNISNVSVRNVLRFYQTHELIRTIDGTHRFYLYEFCFMRKRTHAKGNPENTSITTVSPELFLRILRSNCHGANQLAVADLLLKYLHTGHPEFSSFDIVEELGVSPKVANNHLRMLEENNVIQLVRVQSHVKYFCFCESDEAVSSDDISTEYIVFKLQELAQSSNEKKSTFAKIFLRYLEEGKTSFTTGELTQETGLENDTVHNTLRPFRYKGLITNTEVGYSNLNVYRFNIKQTALEEEHYYSDAVMEMIENLETSTSSQKDRRIGKMLRSCLDKGCVTKHDYALEGEPTKWKNDMRFAAQLGLVKKVNNNEYRILHELEDAFQNLKAAQKATLSVLYDLFGEEAFSAEMVIANLDYSSAHVSGILHQFTWLKLLDCTTTDGSSYSYQLNVNPTDNPECFARVA